MPILQKLAHTFKTEAKPATTDATPSGPAFDNKLITVIYVLGGPGAGELLHARLPAWLRKLNRSIHSNLGKGTESELLVKDYDFVHLSGSSV